MYIKMNDDKSLIITVPSTIYRGENNSGMITFLVPAQYQGKNLTECSFWMRYTLPNNVGDSEPLSIESEIHKGYLKLSTTINTRISKEEGSVTVWLTATDSSDYVVFKSGELRINISPSQDISDCLEQEDVDQLDLIDIEVDKLQDAVEDLEERIGQSAEGISPTITLNETDDGVLLAITDKDGTKTATIRHGQDGKQGPVGETGATGPKGSDGRTPIKDIDYFDGKDGHSPEVMIIDGIWHVDGKSTGVTAIGPQGEQGIQGAQGNTGETGASGKDGRDGVDGKDGKDGYTPVKGVDYFDGEDGRDGVDGKSGVYVGSGDMPEGYNVQIDPNGESDYDPNATLTADGIKSALGYTPANEAAVSQLSEEKVVKYSAQNLTEAEKAQARKNIGVSNSANDPKIEGTAIEETCIKFAKMMYGTDKAESFIFFTDPHVCNPPNADAENKMLTNLGILKTYYDATPTSFVVCGGDWLNDIYQSNTNDDACYKLGRVASWMRANFDRFYTAIGNHEDNYPYGAEYEGAGRNTVKNGLSMETLRNLMMPYEKELYYSFDGAQTKFYVMNTSDVENDQQMTDYRWGQVAWLAERLKEDDATNSALVMHSILLRPIGEGVFAHLAENLLKLCQAYNNGTTITLNGITYDFAGCKGCVRFMLGGHVHDADCAEVHYGIPVILTYNMCRSADSGNGYKPVFDLCLADYDKEEISMVRVGDYGTDRNVPMASRGSNGNTYTVELNLTDVSASNFASIVREGTSYENVLTIPKGYTLSTVAVTMGGVDITATAYSNGQIYINDVTGDIVITAVAAAIPVSYTNLADPTSDDWHNGVGLNPNDGSIISAALVNENATVTNFIPIKEGDVLRLKGFDYETGLGSGYGPTLVYYDENKVRVANQFTRVSDAGKYNSLPVGLVADENGVLTHTMIIRGDTNQQYTYNEVSTRSKYVRIAALRTVPVDEIIITLNEEIY